MEQRELNHIKPYEGSEKYIFVSYCHKDNEAVMNLLRLLENAGYRFWYDEGIDPGSDWPEVIAEHLDKCDSCIAVITPNALESHNCRREINFALRRKKPLISVFLEPAELSLGMEMQLFSSQVMFKYEYPSEEAFMEKLKSAECLKDSLASAGAASAVGPAHSRAYVPDLFAVTGGGVKNLSLLPAARAKRRRWITVSAAICFVLVLAVVAVATSLRKDSVSARAEAGPEGGPDNNKDVGSLLFNLGATGDNGAADPDATGLPDITAEPAATEEPVPTEEPAATPVPFQNVRKLVVPDLRDLDPEEAVRAIYSAGFFPEEAAPSFDRTVRLGCVSKQSPAAFSSAYAGDTVYYSVCEIDPANLSESLKKDAKEYNGHTYVAVKTDSTWSYAQELCAAMGGHLATVGDAGEQAFLERLAGGQERFWLGGFREPFDPDSWQWVTGEPWAYTNWGEDEPNGFDEFGGGEDRLAIWPRKWNDLVNESREQGGFICEWESVMLPEA